mmetsp:Transcript_20486/g.48600  ORF Transcript_20486/g.48600 Transcript_20486/m.48600 type:complete len:207 (+) Transcript_20486:113-733(+)
MQHDVLQAEVPGEDPLHLIHKGLAWRVQAASGGLRAREGVRHVDAVAAVLESPLVGHVSKHVGDLRPQLHCLHLDSVLQELDADGIRVRAVGILQRALGEATLTQDLLVARGGHSSSGTQAEPHQVVLLELGLVHSAQLGDPGENVDAQGRRSVHEAVQAEVLDHHVPFRLQLLRHVGQWRGVVWAGDAPETQMPQDLLKEGRVHV